MGRPGKIEGLDQQGMSDQMNNLSCPITWRCWIAATQFRQILGEAVVDEMKQLTVDAHGCDLKRKCISLRPDS